MVFSFIYRRLGGTRWMIGLAVLVLSSLIVSGIFLYKTIQKSAPQISLSTRQELTLSPSEVRSIRELGEWEFLSITTEEFVESRRKHLTGDDILAAIYQGTLRIGTDLRQIPPDGLITDGDIIRLRLPKVHLLNAEFIDEAQTRIFHEEGKWSANDKQALYEQARHQMMRRSLTPTNLDIAKCNAEEQLTRFFSSLGFITVQIEWF